MRRRDFVAGLVLATAPGWLRAQQAPKVYRIAYIDPTSPIAMISGGPQDWPWYRAFIDELRRLGYVEERNLLIDKFSAERHVNTDYDEVAREVVRRSPDLIASITTPSSLALRKETRTIPIVFLTITDPVGSGWFPVWPNRGATLPVSLTTSLR
jgi:putative ABC transport system substrate-binding protein